MSMIRSRYSKSFLITLATLPAIVQVVIMLVNGNVGTGVAVMGAFSLVRFRSVPGSAQGDHQPVPRDGGGVWPPAWAISALQRC